MSIASTLRRFIHQIASDDVTAGLASRGRCSIVIGACGATA